MKKRLILPAILFGLVLSICLISIIGFQNLDNIASEDYVVDASNDFVVYPNNVDSKTSTAHPTNFTQFKQAMEDENILDVYLSTDINENIVNSKGGRAVAINVNPYKTGLLGKTEAGVKKLYINSNVSFNQNRTDSGFDSLIDIPYGCTLEVYGAGTLEFAPHFNNGYNSVFLVQGGTLHFVKSNYTMKVDYNRNFTGTISCSNNNLKAYGHPIYITNGYCYIDGDGRYEISDHNNNDINKRSIIVANVEKTYRTTSGLFIKNGEFVVNKYDCGDQPYYGIYTTLDMYGFVIEKAEFVNITAPIIFDSSQVDKTYQSWYIASNVSEATNTLPDLKGMIFIYEENPGHFFTKANPGYSSTNKNYFIDINDPRYSNDFRLYYEGADTLYKNSYTNPLVSSKTELYEYDYTQNKYKNTPITGVCNLSSNVPLVKRFKAVYYFNCGSIPFGSKNIPLDMQTDREFFVEWYSDTNNLKGTGTKSDPVQVKDYNELRYALENSDYDYVEIAQDINYDLSYYDSTSSRNRIYRFLAGIFDAEVFYSRCQTGDYSDGYNTDLIDQFYKNRMTCNAIEVRGKKVDNNLYVHKHIILSHNVSLNTHQLPADGNMPGSTGLATGLYLNGFGTNDYVFISGPGTLYVKTNSALFNTAILIDSDRTSNLIIDDATIIGDSYQASQTHAIWINSENSTLTINSGTFKGMGNGNGQGGSYKTDGTYFGAAVKVSRGTVTINNGSFIDLKYGEEYRAIPGIHIGEKVNATINAGYFPTGIAFFDYSYYGEHGSQAQIKSVVGENSIFSTTPVAIDEGYMYKDIVVCLADVPFENISYPSNAKTITAVVDIPLEFSFNLNIPYADAISYYVNLYTKVGNEEETKVKTWSSGTEFAQNVTFTDEGISYVIEEFQADLNKDGKADWTYRKTYYVNVLSESPSYSMIVSLKGKDANVNADVTLSGGVNGKTAKTGQTITIAVTPNENTVVKEVKVTQGGNPIAVTNNQFKMPAGAVTVSVTIDHGTHTVTYKPESGSNVIKTANDNNLIQIWNPDIQASPQFAKKGYRFVGWKLENSSTKYSAGQEITLYRNIVVTPTYEVVPFSINYYDGSHLNFTDGPYKAENVKLLDINEAYAKDYYRASENLVGWTNTKGDNNVVYSLGQVYEDMKDLNLYPVYESKEMIGTIGLKTTSPLTISATNELFALDTDIIDFPCTINIQKNSEDVTYLDIPSHSNTAFTITITINGSDYGFITNILSIAFNNYDEDTIRLVEFVRNSCTVSSATFVCIIVSYCSSGDHDYEITEHAHPCVGKNNDIKTCTICGKVIEEACDPDLPEHYYINLDGVNFNTNLIYIEEDDADCYNKYGVRGHYECPECGKLFTTTSDKSTNPWTYYIHEKTPEELVIEPGHEPSGWYNNGSYHYQTCIRCATGIDHKVVYLPEYDGLCVDENEDGICDICNLTIFCVHQWGEYEITEPTCQEAGCMERYCTLCGDFDNEGEIYLEKLDHDMTKIEAINPTCFEDGCIEHYHCSLCNKDYVDISTYPWYQEYDPTIKAHHGNISVCEAVEPTCESFGKPANYVCDICGSHFSDSLGKNIIEDYDNWNNIDKLAHQMTKTNQVDPNCQDSGLKAYFHCDGCDKYYEDEQGTILIEDLNAWKEDAGKIAALGHDYIWVFDKTPTTLEDGYSHNECENCHAITDENTLEPKITLDYKVAKDGDVDVYTIEYSLDDISYGIEVSGLFVDAKAANGIVKFVVDNSSIVFDKEAVNQIGGNLVYLYFDLIANPTTEGYELVFELKLEGATFNNGFATITTQFNKEVPAGKLAKVYFINGNTKEDMKATFENDTVTFKTSHFSTFAVVFENVEQPAKGGLTGGAIAGIVIGVLAGVALIGAGVFFFLKKKKGAIPSYSPIETKVEDKEEVEPIKEETEDTQQDEGDIVTSVDENPVEEKENIEESVSNETEGEDVPQEDAADNLEQQKD